jgi:prepilin-type N-terminal cleavage/methylation domain-containing protein
MYRKQVVVRCRAFTIIELVVVIAISALLLGLLLPALQHIRESAARTVCANNLKQIALAMRLYEQEHRCLPPSRTCNQSATWAVLILPYLEQKDLYRSWDLARSYYQQLPVAQQTALSIYFCPSRRLPYDSLSVSGDQPQIGDNLGANYPGALGDYAVCIGTTDMDYT